MSRFAWTNVINLHVIFLHVAWYLLHDQSNKNVVVVVAGGKLVRAAVAAIAAAASSAPRFVEVADVVAARSWTFQSPLEHAWTIRAANVVRKNRQQANVSGLACGPAAANAILLSLNSHRSSPNRCVTVPIARDVARDTRKAKVSWLFCFVCRYICVCSSFVYFISLRKALFWFRCYADSGKKIIRSYGRSAKTVLYLEIATGVKK